MCRKPTQPPFKVLQQHSERAGGRGGGSVTYNIPNQTTSSARASISETLVLLFVVADQVSENHK